jgi:hypothetical protein
MNKRGFTDEQQDELDKLIGIAAHAARLTTESVIGTNEAIAKSAGDLIAFIRRTYPRGPLHLKESLENIVRFCDLATIITTEGPDAPR